jgi:hypothetical protein
MSYFGLQVLTAMTMKSTIFWDVKFTDISGECIAFIFRVKEQVKQVTNNDSSTAAIFRAKSKPCK